MTNPPIQLIEPTESLADEIHQVLEEFRAVDPDCVPMGIRCGGMDDIPAYIQRTRDFAQGRNLPEGWIPSSTYWLTRGDRILGMTGIRHRLTEHLKDFGGHIGYFIRPSEQGKGYGNLILKLALEKALELNIDHALITCAQDNIASQRVIQNNGGVLDSESFSEQSQSITQRYWIEVLK